MAYSLTASVAAVVSFALSRGLSLAEVQEATGVDGAALMTPDGRLPEDVIPRLWCLLSERFPGEPLTLEMARAAPFSFFGDLAHGAQFADTFRSAIGLLRDNRKVMANRLELQLEESSVRTAIIAHHPMDVVDNGRSLEMGTALAVRLFRDFLGVKNAVAHIHFQHGPHTQLEHYAEHFEVPVEFGTADTSIIFSEGALETPIQYANVQLFDYVKTHFARVNQRLTTTVEPDELITLRKAAARNALRGEFGASAVAAAANMSLRSAQRLTATHGSSLQRIIDQVREDRAKEFLSDPQIDISSIAMLLGYSDDRSFRRAFHRWTGLTPTEYRQNTLGQTDGS